MRSNARLVVLFLLLATGVAALEVSLKASIPAVSSYPTVNANPVVADGATQYTVSFKVSDASGYSHIICMRVLFNQTEAGGDSSRGRGYLAWGTKDETITKFGSTWVLADANEGRWGYCADNWGGTTYISPVSCTVANSGKATGGTGYRTVTWTFIARPAWAANPLINDADGWAEDAAGNRIGWRDNPDEFLVVASACTSQVSTPGNPVVTNPTTTSVQVAVNPADSDSDVYCIRVSPAYNQKEYVQPDGTLGTTAFWQTKAQWGTVTVTGLVGGVPYSFRVRAWNTSPGVCPSGYSGSTTVSTQIESHTIDASVSGRPMHRGVIGNATILGMTSAARARLWDVLYDTCARGIAGGLDADTYNWKDMSGQGVGHTGVPGPEVTTTLEWMRLIRDHRSTPLITANTKGIGPLAASGYGRFYYTDTSIETLKKLAADWVRYVNFILPTYRQGDTLPPADQAILDSINWYGKPKLLEPGESPTPKVTYWEIGNEPEVPLPWSTPGVPTLSLDGPSYKARYEEITAAMLAVDPTIKVGPCMLSPNPTLATLDAVLSDRTLPVDFISYHPYGSLYWQANASGDTASSAEAGLRYNKTSAQTAYTNVVNSITRCGRNPADILLIASEYNPSDWKWECSPQIRRVSHALGVADTLLTFAEQGMFAANYWSSPAWCVDGTKTPGYKVFEMALQHWGERLIDSYTDGLNFRMYTTWSPKAQEAIVWAINFSEDCDKPIRLGLNNLPNVVSVTQKRLQKLTGATSLLDTNDPPPTNPPAVDWVAADLTGSITPADFTITLPKATLTLLIFKIGGNSVAQAKLMPERSILKIDNAVVSGVFPECVYVQDAGRTCGIKAKGLLSASAGDVVTLVGRIVREGVEAALEDVVLLSAVPGEPPKPLFVTTSAAGGSERGLQPGTIDHADRAENKGRWGKGLSPIGLLVRTSGRVAYVDQPWESFAYIDDGSGLADGSGRTGMRVSLDYGPVPQAGANAVITGCLGAVDVGGACARYLKPRGLEDLQYDGAVNYVRNGGFETGAYGQWAYSGTGGATRSGTWYAGITPHSGSRFFGAHAFNSTCSGTLVQPVRVPDGYYRVSAWSRVFHTYNDPAAAANRVGLDPAGGTDPGSPNVVWSDWDTQPAAVFSEWHRISTPPVAVSGGFCTVFLQYAQQFNPYHHMNCFDDVELSPM